MTEDPISPKRWEDMTEDERIMDARIQALRARQGLERTSAWIDSIQRRERLLRWSANARFRPGTPLWYAHNVAVDGWTWWRQNCGRAFNLLFGVPAIAGSLLWIYASAFGPGKDLALLAGALLLIWGLFPNWGALTLMMMAIPLLIFGIPYFLWWAFSKITHRPWPPS